MRSKEEKLKLLEETIEEYGLEKLSDPEYSKLESLSERAVFKSDASILKNEVNMCIIVEPSTGGRNYGNGVAYFKIYNASDYSNATKMNRISFTVAKYINHKPDPGMKHWFLTINEINMLYRVLYSQSTLSMYAKEKLSVWEALKKDFTSYTGIDLSNVELDNRYYKLPSKF